MQIAELVLHLVGKAKFTRLQPIRAKTKNFMQNHAIGNNQTKKRLLLEKVYIFENSKLVYLPPSVTSIGCNYSSHTLRHTRHEILNILT